MKKLCAAICMYLALNAAPVSAAPLDLTGYQDAAGAVTTKYKGTSIDPYFVTKALLTASDGGLDIRKPAHAWVKWAMSMQRESGLFGRYSRIEGGEWMETADADADDAMLALWLELLYRLAPSEGVSVVWKESIGKAEIQLDALLDDKQGIYLISRKLPVGLLMDNVEIYNAFVNIAREQKRLGMHHDAKRYASKAAALNMHILKVFGKASSGAFSISTQERNEQHFYPDHVAQLYPLLYSLGEVLPAQETYDNWINAHGKEWMKQARVDYPWGLVAVASLMMDDKASAACWRQNAEPMRYSEHWNILEESALQLVAARLSNFKGNDIACVGGRLI